MEQRFASEFRDRLVRIVMDFRARHIGQKRIEQGRQHPDEPGLGLSAESEKDEVMTREHRVNHLRHNTIVITDNSRKQWFFALEFTDQVGAKLVLDRPCTETLFRIGALAQLPE